MEMRSGGAVENEFLGYAEMAKGTPFKPSQSVQDFVDRVSESAESVHWIADGWPPGDSEDVEGTSEPIESDQDPEAPEDEESSENVVYADVKPVEDPPDPPTDGPANATVESNLSGAPTPRPAEGEFPVKADEVLTISTDGEPVVAEYCEEDEPYVLPKDATEDDIEPGVRYAGTVNGIKSYGIFVRIKDTSGTDDVSGLVHKNRLRMHHPEDFDYGDQVIVELEDRDGGLSFYLVETDNEQIDDDVLYPQLENDGED